MGSAFSEFMGIGPIKISLTQLVSFFHSFLEHSFQQKRFIKTFWGYDVLPPRCLYGISHILN